LLCAWRVAMSLAGCYAPGGLLCAWRVAMRLAGCYAPGASAGETAVAVDDTSKGAVLNRVWVFVVLFKSFLTLKWILLSCRKLIKVVASLKAREEEVNAKEALALAKHKEVEALRKAQEKVEVELVEARRMNNELQLQRRKMSVQLAEAQAHMDRLIAPESQQLKKAQMEAMLLRQRVADLLRQVEGLQNSRFSEVEEVVYLRWVNACLRFELRHNKAMAGGKDSALSLNNNRSPRSQLVVYLRWVNACLRFELRHNKAMAAGGKDSALSLNNNRSLRSQQFADGYPTGEPSGAAAGGGRYNDDDSDSLSLYNDSASFASSPDRASAAANPDHLVPPLPPRFPPLRCCRSVQR
ncbi:unnamed protein product, partial [Closterium sp. NIES-54]